jgi:chromosome segregation ATPase
MLRSMELSIKKIQPRYQEALNDRAHFEKEITSALQEQAKLRQKADAKDEVDRELKEARTALSSSAIPEIAEFNKLKEEILALKIEIERLEKRYNSVTNEQSFFLNQYQIASAEASQAIFQNKVYEEELKALRPKCASNAVEIHQIHKDSEISQHLDRIKELTAENAEYERELEKKTEELKALMNGRRGATRGTSVPRSPRLGTGTMSPGTGAVRRVIAQGSRGNSPAPGEFGRPGQFGEALFQGVGGGRWGNHLQ